jgi:flavin reductase (DIM6/NTAB) family NADH-FMN oxidoreductase RutF
MQITFAGLSEAATYHLLTQTLMPRPIAWVMSADADRGASHLNIAPFSFFTPIASEPPLLAFSIGNGLGGRVKDTDRNSAIGSPIVVHIPSVGQAADVQSSARDTAREVSELEAFCGDAELDHDWDFALPRLAASPIAYGCIVRQRIDLAATPGQQVLVIAEAQVVSVTDAAHATDAKGRRRIDPVAIDPLARLGSGRFAGIRPLA